MPDDLNNELLDDFFKLVSTAKTIAPAPVKEEQEILIKPEVPPIKELEKKIETDLVGKISSDLSSLGDLFKTISEGKKAIEKKKEEDTKLQPLLGELSQVFEDPKAFTKKKRKAIVIKKQEDPVQEETIEKVLEKLPTETTEKIVQPVESTKSDDNLEKKLKAIVKNLQNEIDIVKKTIASQRSNTFINAGSGEVNLKYLDDVDASTIQNGRILSYDDTTRKFVFIPNTAGQSNIITQVFNLSGLSYTIDVAQFNITHIISLEVRKSTGEEVSIVSKIIGTNIEINSIVDMSNLVLRISGI